MCIEIRTHWIWYFVGQPYILSNQITRKMFIKGGDRTNFKKVKSLRPVTHFHFLISETYSYDRWRSIPLPSIQLILRIRQCLGIFFLLVNFCLLIHHCKYVCFYKQWIKYIILFCPWTANNSEVGVESGRGVLKGMSFLKLI